MKKTYLIAVVISLILTSCNSKKQQEKNVINDSHTSEISLDWNGTYKGFLPCASCEGILVTVKLENDKTFEITNFYLGTKSDGFVTEKGSFTFTEDGDNIILTLKDGSQQMYAVGENKLIMLTKEGKKSDAEFAKMYELQKVSDEAIEFGQEAVKGLLVFGHEVSSFTPCGSSKSYWIKDVKTGDLYKKYKAIMKATKSTVPYTPVIAELVVKNIGKTKDGFAEQYDGVLETIEIKSVKSINAENNCNN